MGFLAVSYLILITSNTFIVVSGNVNKGRHRYDIINGHPINITDAPFFAIYREVGEGWGCGASIVHERFLVTACQCVYDFSDYEHEIVVGTDKVNEGTTHEIKNVKCHPKYQYSDYNVAVIELKEQLSFNERVNKIEMADSNIEIKEGDIFETMGFGRTSEGGWPTDVLLAVDVQYFDHKKCNEIYNKYNINITESMICAGGKTEDACYGDVGGPLRFKGKLIGDVSCGYGCGRPGYPRIYGFIPAMREFIDSMIN